MQKHRGHVKRGALWQQVRLSLLALITLIMTPFNVQRAYPFTINSAKQTPTAIGELEPFYRGTQLQSIFAGEGLMQIPPYLLRNDIDIRYRRNPKLSVEIPFVDRITFTRFLGGYATSVLKRYRLWDKAWGRESADYVRRKPDGSLSYNDSFVKDRLGPYIDAGYTLADITLSLSNIPWALARNGGEEGVWGQGNPIASESEWKEVINHLLNDLHTAFPSQPLPHFKLGGEYDSRESFFGSNKDYLDYYFWTAQQLASVSPKAELTPGEFTGAGTCTDFHICVYDTRELEKFAVNKGIPVADFPRSLHELQNQGPAMPSVAVKRAVNSYERLANRRVEIHQFGLLGQPFSGDAAVGGDVGARQAAWEFQALIGLRRALDPALVNHWNTFEAVAAGQEELLNGSGFVRLLLNRYLHSTMTELPFTAESSGITEVMPIEFAKGGSRAIVVSTFTPGNDAAEVAVTLNLAALASGVNGENRAAVVNEAGRIIRYSEHNNVFMRIRQDLSKVKSLKPQFETCPLCVSDPIHMSISADTARSLVLRNAQAYEAIISAGLRFASVKEDERVEFTQDRATIHLDGNEVLVLEMGDFEGGK